MSAASELISFIALTATQVIPPASADKSITTAMILVRTRKRARNDMGVSESLTFLFWGDVSEWAGSMARAVRFACSIRARFGRRSSEPDRPTERCLIGDSGFRE